MSYKDNIGRVGLLHSLVLKPELNGVYVLITSYSTGKDRYGIKTLLAPNSTTEAVSILVKLVNIELSASSNFSVKFPNAVTQQDVQYPHLYAPGTIFDFARFEHQTHKMGVLTGDGDILIPVTRSCRMLGVRDALELGGRPLTKFLLPVIVLRSEEIGSVIEFVNIDFVNGHVECREGWDITFRNCRFGGQMGLVIGGVEPCRSVLENCTFEGNVNSVTVQKKFEMVLINSTFTNCANAVGCGTNASAVIKHCCFKDTKNGVVSLGKGCTVDVANSTFIRCVNGVFIRGGGIVNIIGCRLECCTCNSLSTEGPKCTTIHIESTVVTNCDVGVHIDLGKVKPNIGNCELSYNRPFGLYLAYSLVGSARVSNCAIVNNEKWDLKDCCGPHCVLTVDGVVQESGYHADEFVDTMRCYRIATQAGANMSLKKCRAYNKIDSRIEVNCRHCNLVEPTNSKFKMCAKCKNVAYCSRECQVAHWAEHKKECGIVKYV